jgi:hypothetical protein
MFGSNALEIAIGLVFLYLLLSLLCTVINEGIANALEQRGKNLLEGVKNLLDDRNLTALLNMFTIMGLSAVLRRDGSLGIVDCAQPSSPPPRAPPKNGRRF